MTEIVRCKVMVLVIRKDRNNMLDKWRLICTSSTQTAIEPMSKLAVQGPLTVIDAGKLQARLRYPQD